MMKTLLLLLFLTCIIGTGAFLVALSMRNPFPAQAVGFGVWIFFFWALAKRSQRAAKLKARERLFDEWLYMQNRNQRRSV